MKVLSYERWGRSVTLVCAAAVIVAAGCSGSDESDDVAAVPDVTVEALGPNGVADFTVVATVTGPPLFLTQDTSVGSLCGGDRGAGTAVETSRVDLFREGEELIEGLSGPGVVDEIVLNDDGSIASMTCSFGVGIDLSATDAEPYDLLFTSGRTTDAVTIEKPSVTAETLTGVIELTR